MMEAARALLRDIRTTVSSIERRALVVLLSAPVLLTWLEFFGNRRTLLSWLGDEPLGLTAEIDVHRLGWAWWSLNGLAVFVFVPLALVLWVLRDRPSDYGLAALDGPALRRHASIALALYVVVLPFVVTAAHTETFRQTYPLWSHARGSVALMVQWWVIYLPAFFAVEFFFRGWMLFGLERQCGAAAILVSALPYCMVHFHKPMAEAYGAIIAGIGLGYVALRTRCIWSGVMVHVMVALTMDILAFLQP